MTKTELRTLMNAALRRIDRLDAADRSARIAGHLRRTDAWMDAELVLAFLSMPREVVTDELIGAARAEGKAVAVPRIEGDRIRFLLISEDPRSLPLDKWAIPVPDPAWPEPDLASYHRVLVVVPGLAFDRTGNRLGRGKGYYDRFLGEARAAVGDGCAAIAVCFKEQVVDGVPVNQYDLRIDGIVTEDGPVEMA